MNTNLLYVPLRETRDVDLATVLREEIKKHFFQPPSLFEADLRVIDSLRRTVARTDKVSDKSLAPVRRYIFQLGILDKKFGQDLVEFEWFGTLGYSPLPQRVKSFKLETLNVVYQLGAIHSQLALLESRYSEQGLKSSCLSLQMASGCFQYMVDLMKGWRITDGDFELNTIECLKTLMLAQAQEIAWQMALMKLKDSAIAKLSVQVSDYYSQAHEWASASDYIKLEWVNHIAMKKYHFSAAAHYRMSTISLEDFKYGEQVGYLRKAQADCTMALKYKKYVTKVLLDDLQGLVDAVGDTLRVAEKENDLVYLHVVPGPGELTPIQGSSIVKVIIPDSLISPSGTPVFKDLVPFFVIQVALAYRERRDDFVREHIATPISALNKILSQFLSSRDLPAAIDTIQKPENIPESIVSHSQDIVSQGGIEWIEDTQRDIGDFAIQSKKLVDGLQERLLIEADEDDILRSRIDVGEDRLPSEVAGAELYTKVQKMREYLHQAYQGDQVVLQQYLDIKKFLELYVGGYDRLIEVIPNAALMELDPETKTLINELRAAVQATKTIKEQRARILRDVNVKIKNVNVLERVLAEYKKVDDIKENSFEYVYEAIIGEFDEDLAVVESLKQKQASLERDIDNLNSQFVAAITGKYNDSQSEHKQALQVLEEAYLRYLELISNIEEGTHFYREFLQKTCLIMKEYDDFLYRRRLEAREIEQHHLRERERNSFNEGNDTEVNEGGSPITSPLPVRLSGVWRPEQGIKFG